MIRGGGDSSTTTTTSSVQQLAAGTAVGGGVGGAHHEAAGSEVGLEMMDVELGGDRSFGGNRWPRQETIALLRIRSEMDAAFRDASVKAPLWDEVSRKLGELGFNRSAKKCKEKFENVYKYHKRTKESKQEGKTYRFFDELQAFDQINSNNHPPPPPPMVAPPIMNQPPSTTVTSTTATVNMGSYSSQPIANLTIPSFLPPITTGPTPGGSFASLSSDLWSNSTSSSTSSDDMEMRGRGKRKRKWKDFFERLMRPVIERQEQMQKKFLEAIEKREQERLAKEESWRMQEMSRINREREILAQERSISSAKDSAVMAFLQKLSEQQQQPNSQQHRQQQPQQVTVTPTATATPPQPQPVVVTPPPRPQPPKQPAPLQLPLQQQALVLTAPNLDRSKSDITVEDRSLISPGGPSPSRWPKSEVIDLIRLRANLDSKYQENGPKGPLWEEISAGMKRLGYNRNSKRCKEKWENINKYFKKVKESNKKRPEDSKTCPYFQELEALYKEKNSKLVDHNNVGPSTSSSATQLLRAVDNSVALMVQPEQQWPPAGGGTAPPVQLQSRGGEDLESEEGNEEDEEEEDDEASHGYEIVANNKSATIST